MIFVMAETSFFFFTCSPACCALNDLPDARVAHVQPCEVRCDRRVRRRRYLFPDLAHPVQRALPIVSDARWLFKASAAKAERMPREIG